MELSNHRKTHFSIFVIKAGFLGDWNISLSYDTFGTTYRWTYREMIGTYWFGRFWRGASLEGPGFGGRISLKRARFGWGTSLEGAQFGRLLLYILFHQNEVAFRITVTILPPANIQFCVSSIVNRFFVFLTKFILTILH